MTSAAASELSDARAHYHEVMSRTNATEGQEGRAEHRLRQAERAAGVSAPSSEVAAAEAHWRDVCSSGTASEKKEGEAWAALERARRAQPSPPKYSGGHGDTSWMDDIGSMSEAKEARLW